MMGSLTTKIEQIQRDIDFSGVTFVKKDESVLIESTTGYANRGDSLKNRIDTRFGIASGCKIFTAVAICQLVEKQKLTFDTKLKECLDIYSPHFDENITIHHLLTHTSGIPDYFDEEVMDDFEELWIAKPMYHMRHLDDFLPFFQNEKMKANPGERFHYNNAGYILLGLIIEKVSGQVFTDYVQQHVFDKAGMVDSGYFALDKLPGNVATGYIDYGDGTWKTNVYSLPVQGGSDGGAFVSAIDMVKFWDALLNNALLSESVTNQLLFPHVLEDGNDFYGYGVWIAKKEGTIFKYHVMGYDPGVSFHSAFYPDSNITLAICANISKGAFKVMKEIEDELM